MKVFLTIFATSILLAAVATQPSSLKHLGTLPPAETQEVPPIFAKLEKLLGDKKYVEVVTTADEALKETPNDFRLIAIKSFTQFKFLNDRPGAFATVDKAIAKYPKLYDLYDFKIELIRHEAPEDIDAKVLEVYKDIATNFSDKPLQISNVGFGLLQQPLGETRLAPAMLLLITAKNNITLAQDAEKYLISTNLARGYYFSSRADLAAREQRVASTLAINEMDKVNSARLLSFYGEAAAMAKELK